MRGCRTGFSGFRNGWKAELSPIRRKPPSACFRERTAHCSRVIVRGRGGRLAVMKASICAALMFLAPAALHAAPVRLVTFAKGSEPALTLRATKAIVYDRDATKLFVADSAFIARLSAGELRIHAWNPSKSLVRISPRGSFEAWLGCETVEPTAIACSDLELTLGLDNDVRVSRKATSLQGASRLSRSTELGDLQESAKGLPACPGDPRCPSL